MQIRPANEADEAIIQELYDAFYPAPTPPVSRLVTTHRMHVAEEGDGSVVGVQAISPAYFTWIAVAEAHQRKGIGTLLLNDVLDDAAEKAAPELTSRVNDGHAGGLALCERFGFKPYLHMVNLKVDLNHWDDSALTPALEKVQAEGIVFKTYADYENNTTNQRRLYELNKALSATVPRDEVQPFMPFETYVERQIFRKVCPHEGLYLAVDGDQWIGMGQVSLQEGYAFIEMTGVLPAYRGRGIAQALKLLDLQFAKLNQQRIVKTFNDVSNAPMIAVNEKAGFQKGRGFYQVRRKLV